MTNAPGIQNVRRYDVQILFIVIAAVTVGVAVLTNYGAYAEGMHSTIDQRRLYTYSARELSGFLEDMDQKDLWYNDMPISRNSDGTALRFMNGRKKKGIVAKCDGSLKIVDIPGEVAWLNDADQVVVWADWVNNRSVVHYANGTSEKLSFHPQEAAPDPSGKYFLKTDLSLPASQSCYTAIYSTDRPNIPLAKVDVCGATKIFYKDAKVFLTGRQYRDGSLQEEEIRIFAEKGNSLEQVDRIIVPNPNGKSDMLFYAVDLAPWNDQMLFLDAHDFPSRSIWYTFDLRSHQLKRVGKVPWFGGYAYYLQCDIIKKVAEAGRHK